jgi:DNA primase
MNTDVLAEIREKIDIVELISDYLPLKRSGDNYRALCPFHNEKKPSFNVNRSKQIFYCFGCKKGGDIFSFMMLHEGLSFAEAVRHLADRAGVTLPARHSGQERQRALRERIAEVNRLAAAHFRSGLARSERARRYLTARQVPEPLWERFGLGYAADAWSSLYDAAKSAGFDDDTLAQGGLVKAREGGGYYDLFRDRIMFPIMDGTGKVRGFGGRALDETDVKYINSPETALYHKGGLLYGMYQAKEALRRTGVAYVVEGYFDLIAVVAAGIDNVVASLGTALTEEQARLLRRHVSRVALIYDTDEAGISAALRGVEVLLSCGLVPKLVRLAGDKDPDDFVRTKGAERFRATVAQEADFLDFLLAVYQTDKADVEGRAAVARRGLELIENVKDELKRSEYLKLFAEKLDMSERAMRAEFAKGVRRKRHEPEQAEQKLSEVEADVVRLLIDRPDLLEEARRTVRVEDVASARLRQLLTLVFLVPSGEKDAGDYLMGRATDPETRAIVAGLLMRETSVDSAEKAIAEWMQSVSRSGRQRKAEQLQRQIQLAERQGDTTAVMSLLKQKAELVG